MSNQTKTITLLCLMSSVLMFMCGFTMFQLGKVEGKQVAYEEFQESECWVDKTSNDVDCTRHVKRGEMNNIDKEGE